MTQAEYEQYQMAEAIRTNNAHHHEEANPSPCCGCTIPGVHRCYDLRNMNLWEMTASLQSQRGHCSRSERVGMALLQAVCAAPWAGSLVLHLLFQYCLPGVHAHMVVPVHGGGGGTQLTQSGTVSNGPVFTSQRIQDKCSAGVSTCPAAAARAGGGGRHTSTPYPGGGPLPPAPRLTDHGAEADVHPGGGQPRGSTTAAWRSHAVRGRQPAGALGLLRGPHHRHCAWIPEEKGGGAQFWTQGV